MAMSEEERKRRGRERAKKNYWKDVEASRAKQRGEYAREPQKHRDAYRAKIERNREGWKARWRLAKKLAREQDPERIRAYAREFYAKNRDRELGKITQRRIANDPSRGLANAIRDFEGGRISLDDFVGLIGERVARSLEKDIERGRSRGCSTDVQSDRTGNSNGARDRGTDQNKSGPDTRYQGLKNGNRT